VPITFHCACGQSITVADQFAGKMGRCPGCKNPVQVPGPGGAPAAPPMGTPGAQPRPVPRVTPPPVSAPSLARSTQNAAPPRTTQKQPQQKITAKLQIVNGPQVVVGRNFGLTAGKPHVIGRDPQVDIPIPSDRISRRHCQLEPTADGVFVLTDLGSSNGTLVNQERINGRKVLLGGEYIQIGDVLIRFLDS
jgi:pSer/pThr/pTyr-binding forkhead associated (FHA) protein